MQIWLRSCFKWKAVNITLDLHNIYTSITFHYYGISINFRYRSFNWLWYIYTKTLNRKIWVRKNYTVDAHTDLENYSDRLRVAMSRLRLSPPRATNPKDTLKELDTCSHVFLRRIAIAPPLTAPYDGPYKVVARSGRVFKVLIKGKVETVTADRVKPAHIERTPEEEQTRQSTAMSKTTAIRPMAKILEPQSAVVGKRSTATSTPSEAGVCTKQTLNGQSTLKTKATAPEVSRRGEKPGEQLNTKATLYKAPHVGNVTTSCANGRYDGIYSRIPLHLRKDVPIQTQQNKRIGNHNESNTDHSRRVTINPPPIQTRLGRQIHTPGRFVQLVHAVIAPNDIYCGPSARKILLYYVYKSCQAWHK